MTGLITMAIPGVGAVRVRCAPREPAGDAGLGRGRL